MASVCYEARGARLFGLNGNDGCSRAYAALPLPEDMLAGSHASAGRGALKGITRASKGGTPSSRKRYNPLKQIVAEFCDGYGLFESGV